MGKSFLLVCADLRKAKGQTAAIFVLIVLASLMLNLWLILSMDYKQNFDRYHTQLNEGHVTLAVDDDSAGMRRFLEETLEKEDLKRETDAYSLDPALHAMGSFGYNDGEVATEFVFLDKKTALSRPVGRMEILEEGGMESGIYMPILYRSKEIAVGKTVEIAIGNEKMRYTICGFFNSAMVGSHNCSMCGFILTGDAYRHLKESGHVSRAVFCSIRLKDKAVSEECEVKLKKAVSAYAPHVHMSSNSYALITQSRYISQMVCAGIMSAMAFFVLLIALVVIASNIVNYIQENMKTLGALKAIGYTGRQLAAFLLLEFLSVSMLASLLGVGLSYVLFPAVNEMMISQTGIPYEIHFLPVPFLLTLAVLGGAVALAVWLSSRQIRRIEPIIALRQGIRTHNFKRDHIPLEKTKIPLQAALAFKTTLSGIKHNITVCVTMLVLSLVVVFLGVMIENVIMDAGPFLELIVGEVADSGIDVRAEAEESFVQEMEADARVEKVYLYNSVEVQHVGGLGLAATVCDDLSKVNNERVVFEGRFPRFDNEVALAAKYAGEKRLEIGQEMTLAVGGEEADYIITGFTQISNNLGKDCILTRDGYERLCAMQNVCYYLNLAEDCDIDQFNTEIEERFGDQVNATIDMEALVEGGSAVYVSLMKMIVAALLVSSMIVIIFVLYLIIRALLNSKKRDYGILKALGYTTGQLVFQTALSFMPTIIGATVAGLILCSVIINPMIGLFLHSIGIVKSTWTVPVGLIVGEGAGLIVFAFGVACALSLRIRKIVPRALLAGE